jgi:hypothetical protein
VHKAFFRTIFVLIIFGIVFLLLIQLIPYGRNHSNPPIVTEPNWDSQLTRELVKNACFDCHSNETIWPWYSKLAPVSWLVYRDVVEGRQRVNFSDWKTTRLEEPEELTSVIREGEMPPIQYILIHQFARLTAAQKDQLINGLHATINR